MTFQSSAIGQSGDSGPKIINSMSYTMPASAVEAEIGGTVVMAIRVDETGIPTRAALTIGPMWPCGTEPVKALEELSSSLTRTMMSLKFSPALEKGKPVAKNIALTIQLKNPKLPTQVPPIDPATNKPKVTNIQGGVLNGKAKLLPKPRYPSEARANHDSGQVTISVLIDEQGKIIRAGAVSGAPTLQFAAREAACSARFSRTTLMGVQ